jgi:preprotein translocase subunit SecA
MPDVVYMSEKEKFSAIVEELARYNASGRPLLVGTAANERSEVCSALLQRRGVPHQVLNAKQHEREAQIVAKAGELGSVTIATNMAGRGTDIVLGTFERQELINHWREHGLAPKKCKADDPDCAEQLVRHWAGIFLPEKKREGTPEELRERLVKEWNSSNHPILALGTHVQALGGLHILGTERHDSRRIDNQLRGRSGRQGDPGSSQFFLSLEDSLMRRFAGPKVQALLRRLGMKEGDDITSPMVSKQIEKAQAKVELHNFEIRKNLLEYDEVMNEQRKTIYSMRQDILEHTDQRDRVLEMMDHVAESAAGTYMNPALDRSERDPAALSSWINEVSGIDLGADQLVEVGSERLPGWLAKRFRETYEAKEAQVGAAAKANESARVTDAEEALKEALDLFLSAVPEDIEHNAVSFSAWYRHRSSAELDPAELVLPVDDNGENSPEQIAALKRTLLERGVAAVREREAESTQGVMRRFESVELLRTIDTKWKDHLLSMDHLRDSIGLRSYAQVDPKVEYKKEGYQMFRELLDNIRTDVISHVMHREPPIDPFGLSHLTRLVPIGPTEPMESHEIHEEAPPEPQEMPSREVLEAQHEAHLLSQQPAEPTGPAAKVGRNDPCPCGSGTKFKKCHGKQAGDDAGPAAPAAPIPPSAGDAGGDGGGVPKVGKNKPCPCGSGKKYKQCHGKA